jgi:hypothetical protein
MIEIPEGLSAFERADRYRELAAEALQRAAQAASDGSKANLIGIAARWDGLAQDIERRLDLPPR